jgi:hypothetical protein
MLNKFSAGGYRDTDSITVPSAYHLKTTQKEALFSTGRR